MTTLFGNNSVFRSFFKKQKLTGPNFIDWYRQVRLVLLTEDKENYLEHPILAAPVAQPGQQVPLEALAAHAAWVKGQKEVAVLMLLDHGPRYLHTNCRLHDHSYESLTMKCRIKMHKIKTLLMIERRNLIMTSYPNFD
ncbi:hypothetical protein Tco_0148198, partial [Tanacetum coccineum]